MDKMTFLFNEGKDDQSCGKGTINIKGKEMIKVLVVMALALAVASPAMAGIAETKHDMVFSGYATLSGGNTEICVFCHTPHGAVTGNTQAPLWNNTPITSVATPYTSDTSNWTATVNDINATDARLCLACHDTGIAGLTLVNPSSGGQPGVGATAMSANAILGNVMSNDHPVGIVLGANPEGTDSKIKSIGEISDSITGFGYNPFFPTPGTNTMWCSSCHNVHDNTYAPFLRKNNTGSALCLACHKK